MKRIKYLFILWQGLAFLAFTSYGQVRTGLKSGSLSLIKSQSTNPGDNVHCSLQDKAGNIWFGTTGDGVYYYDGTFFTNFTTKNGLNSNMVNQAVSQRFTRFSE